MSLSSDNPVFTVTPSSVTPSNGSVNAELTVKYTPTTTGNHSGVITIKSGSLTKTFSVSGKCVSLTGPTSEVGIGDVQVGGYGTATFTLKGDNLTAAPSLVNEQEDYGNEFSVTSIKSSGTSQWTVTVKFTPSGAHNTSARLTFQSGLATTKVTVTGKGVKHRRFEL